MTRVAVFIITILVFMVISASDKESINDILDKASIKEKKAEKAEKEVKPDKSDKPEKPVKVEKLEDIKIWDSPDSIRVVLYPSAEVHFKYKLLRGDDKDRVYFDMDNISSKNFKMPEIEEGSFMKGIRLGKRGDGIRVVLDTGPVEKYNVMVMEEPWRIVVDYFGKIKRKNVEKEESAVKEEPKKFEIKEVKKEEPKKEEPKKVEVKKEEPKKIEVTKVEPEKTELPVKEKKSFVLVLDPGHGGKDPGAINKKVFEKDIVLKLAKIIEKKAKKEFKDIRVVLTRDKDIFLPLEERAAIANKLDGDLFVSLHANSYAGKKAEGIEIYHLDNRRDTYTDKLAMVENKLTNENSLLNTILVDMTMSFYINDSMKFAETVGKKLELDIQPFDMSLRGYRKGALFYVLVGARMPSLLIEVGFLTNKEERKLLQNEKYLETIADSMLNSIEKVKNENELVKGQ